MTEQPKDGGAAWVKKRKGAATIYTCEGVDRAIVDNGAMGFRPGVFWNGIKFNTVADAMIAAREATQ